jgi:hypothetical protein
VSPVVIGVAMGDFFGKNLKNNLEMSNICITFVLTKTNKTMKRETVDKILEIVREARENNLSANFAETCLGYESWLEGENEMYDEIRKRLEKGEADEGAPIITVNDERYILWPVDYPNSKIEKGDFVVVDIHRNPRIGVVSNVIDNAENLDFRLIVTDISSGYPFNAWNCRKIFAKI